jgi:hypothetical protein
MLIADAKSVELRIREIMHELQELQNFTCPRETLFDKSILSHV